MRNAVWRIRNLNSLREVGWSGHGMALDGEVEKISVDFKKIPCSLVLVYME